MCDANYQFTFADIGASGRESDGGVFNQSQLYEQIENQQLSIPLQGHLPDGSIGNYVIVADDAFPLKTYLMKPYSRRNLTNSQRVFNYRLSRARRCIENAFGVLTARFRFLKTTINMEPEKVKKMVHASLLLHNILMKNTSTSSLPSATNTNSNNNASLDLNVVQGSNYTSEAKNYRNKLCNLFNQSDILSFQNFLAGVH